MRALKARQCLLPPRTRPDRAMAWPGARLGWAAALSLRHAARRAWLVPLRLGVVAVSLLAVLAVLGWNLHRTRLLLQEQAAQSRLMGEVGWRVRLPLEGEAQLLRHRWRDSGWVPLSQADAPALALLGGSRAVRAPDGATAEYRELLLANPPSGLPSRDPAGGTPCVWLGPQPPAGAEWVVEERLRCTVHDTPAGWKALNAELDQAALVVPVDAAGLVLGADWQESVVAQFGIGTSPCGASEALQCSTLAVTRAAGVAAGQAISRWTRWSLPAALGAALIAVIVYLFGLRPALLQEFALRMALGRSTGAALRWWVAAQLAHVVWLVAGVGLAAAGLVQGLGVSPTAWERQWAWVWTASCMACAAVLASVWGWRARHHGLQQLGRVG